MCTALSTLAKRRCRCNPLKLKVMNMFASALILTSVALRLYYLSTGDYGDNAALTVVLAIYQVAIVMMLVLAEFKKKTPRLYFDFLNSVYGRGTLILFIQMLLFTSTNPIIIIIGIVTLLIGLLGVLVGWTLPPDDEDIKGDSPSKAKGERESAAPSSVNHAGERIPQAASDLREFGKNIAGAFFEGKFADAGHSPATSPQRVGAKSSFPGPQGPPRQNLHADGVYNLEQIDQQQNSPGQYYEQPHYQQQQYNMQRQQQQQPRPQVISYANDTQEQHYDVKPQMVEIDLNDDEGDNGLDQYRR